MTNALRDPKAIGEALGGGLAAGGLQESGESLDLECKRSECCRSRGEFVGYLKTVSELRILADDIWTNAPSYFQMHAYFRLEALSPEFAESIRAVEERDPSALATFVERWKNVMVPRMAQLTSTTALKEMLSGGDLWGRGAVRQEILDIVST